MANADLEYEADPNKLLKHRWTILHAPPGISWPTSDNPLIKLNYQDSSNYDTEGGWA